MMLGNKHGVLYKGSPAPNIELSLQAQANYFKWFFFLSQL